MKLRYLSTLATIAALITFTSCEKAKETAEKAKEKGMEAAVKLEEKSKEVAEKIGEKAKEATKATIEKSKELAGKVAAEAKEVTAAAKEKMSEAKEKISEAIHGNDYPPGDKAAFIAGLEPIKKMNAEIKASSQGGPPPLDKVTEMIAAFRALPTKGQPAELKEALTAANDKSEELLEAIKPMLADPTSATPDTQATLQKLMQEGKEAGEKAIEMAAKYGIDLSFMK